MVARIRSGKSIKGAINYNENKVKQGKAKLIDAFSYTKDASILNFHEKHQRLQRLADLNTRATTNCLHVSLNFDPSEQLNRTTLQQIAKNYMQGIGFGKQPYLVYEHHDAAHQHIHIVSTNIQKDGQRISLHDLGRLQSEKARKEIEIKFDLVKAGGKQTTAAHQLTPVNPVKVQYGKQATKQAISNVLTHVIGQYKFASLHELNAILKLYNVRADRGAEGTRMFEKKGLQYVVVDAAGNKMGVPINASTISNKPTLRKLETIFDEKKKAKQLYRSAVRAKVNEALNKSTNRITLQTNLKQQGIDVIFRTNADNYLYGITYVDHKNKIVFNGSELGKECSAACIREKWNQQKEEVIRSEPFTSPTHAQKADELVNALTDPTKLSNEQAFGFRRKRKRKKRDLRS